MCSAYVVLKYEYINFLNAFLVMYALTVSMANIYEILLKSIRFRIKRREVTLLLPQLCEQN